ncbi:MULTISPECIES: DUF932 domain-containing protein [Pandoraea]|uniref:Phage/plasmid-like protein n=2 Tax=Pandoraea TaxID=93217 RepID=A0A5E4XCG4_9BURK|nr:MULTISPECIES: DUF932 domain-containing protein [Pandoraea]VVE16400.1 phage/plasmid-like protein [Pandoraea cepalis]VVE34109.1 phage/plasmid-like protein [Pandoraea terrigena]
MHQLTINELGRAEMAWTGDKPWHGLGQQVQRGASIEEWRQAAGLEWSILRRPVRFNSSEEEGGDTLKLDGHDVLVRSDNLKGLSVVTKKYRVVQPDSVLEFFRDLTRSAGFQIETAGSMREGRTIWVLANTGLKQDIVPGDNVKGYLLLATSYDSAIATTAMYTSTRVVCNNTLRFALNRDVESQVRIRHDAEFDPDVVKSQLGILAGESWSTFVTRMKSFSRTSMGSTEAGMVLAGVLAAQQAENVATIVTETRGYKKIMELFNGSGRGSEMSGVRNTAWGLVNAVTQYVDFERQARNNETRLNSAWFGPGARLKDQIVSQLLELV